MHLKKVRHNAVPVIARNANVFHTVLILSLAIITLTSI